MAYTDSAYVYFSSGASALRALSNFHECVITLMRAQVPAVFELVCPLVRSYFPDKGAPLVFASSEHLWQALKALDRATFLRFTADGDLGSLTSTFFQRVFPRLGAEQLQTKVRYWAQRQCVGIVPKMAANEDHAKKLGLVDHMDFGREHLEPLVERTCWLAILKLKFNQNPALRAVLLSTRGKLLVEYSRFASPDHHEHWAAKVDPATATLWGDNAMGKYVTATRESL